MSVQLEIEHSPLFVDQKKWVVCMDCGLLIEPLVQGKARWTICPFCASIYKRVNHPWLAKMLAMHLASKPRGKNQTLFMCYDCGNYYLRVGKHKGQVKNKCFWCVNCKEESLKHKAKKCVVCHVTINKGAKSIVCDSCKERLDSIKKAMRYAYYISWHANYVQKKKRAFNPNKQEEYEP